MGLSSRVALAPPVRGVHDEGVAMAIPRDAEPSVPGMGGVGSAATAASVSVARVVNGTTTLAPKKPGRIARCIIGNRLSVYWHSGTPSMNKIS
jgi:hypothetical protein